MSKKSLQTESGYFPRDYFGSFDIPPKIDVDLKLQPSKPRRNSLRVGKENFSNMYPSRTNAKVAWLSQRVEDLEIERKNERSAPFVPVPQLVDPYSSESSAMDVEQPQSPIPRLYVECDDDDDSVMEVDSPQKSFAEGFNERYKRLPLSKSLGGGLDAPNKGKSKSSRTHLTKSASRTPLTRKRQFSSDIILSYTSPPPVKIESNLNFSYEESSHDSFNDYLNSSCGSICFTKNSPVDLRRSQSFNGTRSDNEVFRSPERKRKIQKSKKKNKPQLISSKSVLSQSAILSSVFFSDSRSEYIPYHKKRNNPIYYLSPQTVSSYLSNPELAKDTIVYDCRYDYEFEGGHIKGAVHLPDLRALKSHFDHHPQQNDPKVIIFYCEWSSERAPRSYSYMANMDRQLHKECYPKLRYPDIYVMEGGYNHFFDILPTECNPVGYIKMLDGRFMEKCHKYNKLYKTSSKFHL